MKFSYLLILIPALLYFSAGCSFNKEVKDADLITDQEMLDTGNNQLAAGSYQDAVNTYKSMILKFPTSDLHIKAQLKIAEAYGKAEDYEAQMDALLTLLKENIIPEEVPQIYVQIGQFYEQAALFNPGNVSTDTSDYKTAIEYYKKASVYKDSEDKNSKAAGTYRQALVEAKIGAFKEAAAHYQMVQENYSESDFAVLATIKLQNPQDTSELPSDAASLEKYKQDLNLPETTTEPEGVESPVEQAPAVGGQAVESSDVENSVFETSVPDSSAVEQPVEQAPAFEEQPVENSDVENSTFETSAPDSSAVEPVFENTEADSSGN